MTEEKPRAHEYIISRDDHLDLKIKGWMVAEQTESKGTYTKILRIYITVGGMFILQKWSQDTVWGDIAKADIFKSPAAVVEALKDDEGLFGVTEKKLLREASGNSEEFFGYDVIVVE